MISRILGVRAATTLLMIASAGAGIAQAQAVQGDRYGPPSSEAPKPPTQNYGSPQSAPFAAAPSGQPYAPLQSTAPAARVFSGRMLSWPGKMAATPRTAAPLAVAPAPVRYAPTARVSPRFADARARAMPQDLDRDQASAGPPAAQPRYGLVRAAPPPYGHVVTASAPVLAGAPVRAPQSIYDAPAPRTVVATAAPPSAAPQLAGSQSVAPQSVAPRVATAPPATPIRAGWAPPRRPWSGAYGDSVRLYSVHRAYGLKPDAAPIPPQFFAATADVSEPSGPLATRRTIAGAGTAGQAERAVQQSDVDAPSAAAQP